MSRTYRCSTDPQIDSLTLQCDDGTILLISQSMRPIKPQITVSLSPRQAEDLGQQLLAIAKRRLDDGGIEGEDFR